MLNFSAIYLVPARSPKSIWLDQINRWDKICARSEHFDDRNECENLNELIPSDKKYHIRGFHQVATVNVGFLENKSTFGVLEAQSVLKSCLKCFYVLLWVFARHSMLRMVPQLLLSSENGRFDDFSKQNSSKSEPLRLEKCTILPKKS